jgi:hypothetical protein
MERLVKVVVGSELCAVGWVCEKSGSVYQFAKTMAKEFVARNMHLITAICIFN